MHGHAEVPYLPLGLERGTFARRHAHAHGLLSQGRRGVEVGSRGTFEVRIAGAPQQVAASDAGRVDGPIGEAQLHGARAAPHVEDASALFGFFGAAPGGGIEHHPIARLQRHQRFGFAGRHRDRAGFDARHAAHQYAAMARSAPTHYGLVVRAVDETRPQAARIDLFELEFSGAVEARGKAGPRLVHGLTIGACGQRHIIGVLVAAFDLERGEADAHDLRDLAQRIEIARREQVARIAERSSPAIHDQLVGQAAGLRALAAVGAAPAPGLRRETLTGVSHAQRAVNEDLEFAIGGGAYGAHLVERKLTRQGDAARAQLLGQPHAVRAGDAHLGAGVDGQLRCDPPRQARDAQVLDDNGVRASLGDGCQAARRLRYFVVEDQGIEGDVALHAAPVQSGHDLRQLGEREAYFGTRTEMVQSEIDRVRACLDGRAELRPKSGRTHDLRLGIPHGP